MRIRKKPWARPELAVCGFFEDEPQNNAGRWMEIFKKKQPIHLELGCGKGTFISKLAVKNQDINFVAVDIKSEMLGLAKRNIEKEYIAAGLPINNVKLLAHDISRIFMVFNGSDIMDRIYINFCNPWPRKKHNKRRLTHERQLVQYKNFLNKNTGEIYFKTDDEDLFKDSIDSLIQSGFEITYMTENLHESGFCENIETEHEKMFSGMGIPIKFLIAQIT